MKPHLATLGLAVALTLVAGAAWAYWTAGSAPGGNGAAAATSIGQGSTPSASAAGSTVTVTWAASTLGTGGPVTGYQVKRYDAATLALRTILTACSGTVTATSCVESNVPNGSWRYTVTPVFATNWQGTESARSTPLTVATDATPPTNAISLSSVTGGAYLTGWTVYYRGSTAGGLRLTNAVADTGSGPASSTTAALSGISTGWSHNASTVSTPAGGPFVSNLFGWSAGTTSGPGEAVTGRDVIGNPAVTNLVFTNDSTAPTAGTVTYADGFAAGRSVSVAFTTGTDSASGIASRRLQRAQAALNASSCGTFGAFNNIGAAAPTSPYVDATLASACYMYRYVVTDRVGNQHISTSANVVKIGYAGAVNVTGGLLSHWRLGESATALTSEDSFTGATGALLANRTGELGASWALDLGTNKETISAQGQAYRNGSGYGVYFASGVPSSPNYAVEADLVRKSNLTGDMAGVIGRFDTVNNDYYMARWEEVDNSWNIVQVDNGVVSYPSYVANQPDLVTGRAYRLRLEMSGGTPTTLKLYVNGVLTVTATDSTTPVFTAAGRAGIADGNSGGLSVVKSSTTGLHFDNFQVTPATYPRAADSKGSNTGDYVNGPSLGATGALAGDPDTAARFDGVNDHVQVTGTTGFPVGAAVRSTEMWFRTTSVVRQVLFRYGTGAVAQEYGLWIDPGGTTMTAWGFGGGNDKTFTMPGGAVNDGAWHHVVQTYDGASLTLYIDGQALPAQAATRSTVMDQYGFGIGAALRPGDGYSGGFFNGWIDEVSFYTTVLTQGTVTDHYQLGTAPAPDVVGPTGGAVDATGLVGTGSGYSTSTTLNLVLDDGTDPSGLAPSGKQLRRATATLTNGTCGAFGSFALVAGGNDPASPKSDAVADQACYRYEYVVEDTLGNTTTYTSPHVKVDTTAPQLPTLAFSAFTNTWWPGNGSTVYYRPGAASGSLTATATATDPASGIASYAFPALGTGWTATPGAPGVTTYSWSAADPAPGTTGLTATNNAGLNSPNTPFTLTADSTAPTAGTVSYANTTQSSTSVTVSFTTGTDAASGIGTRELQRAVAPLTGTTCGTFGSFATVAGGTNPSSPFTDTVTSGSCYRYRYVVSDNVGNSHTATSANVVKVPVSCGSQLISNGGFENGADPTPWTSSPAGVVTDAGAVGAGAGTWKAMLGGQGTDTTETLSQVVTIPAGCSTATLTYWLRITTSETSHPWDFFRVRVGATDLQSYSDADLGGSYVQRTVDLSAYVGQTITLSFLSDEDGSIVTSFWLDDVSLTAASAVAQGYLDTVDATAGLLSHYRLGEATTSADSMAGSAGATLQSRNGETAAAWDKRAISDADAVITDAGRVRKTGNGTFGALYTPTVGPGSADYTVEADVHVRSNLADDMAGVVGRLDPGNVNGTYYLARYEQVSQKWVLYKRVNGSWGWLGESAQTLTALTTYRLALDMTGSTIRVLVDGVQQISVVDSGISAAGRGGISLGFGAAGTTTTNTAGLQLDNFRISPQLADSTGTNHGDYLGGVTLGTTGAMTGDADTAASFDGVNDFGTATRQIADDFSMELWFKSTQGIGTGTQWWSGAGLVDAEVAGATNDFGVSLRSDGRVVAGVGTPDTSVVSSAGAYNDGAWHHVVFTRARASGVLALYVDGVPAGTATGSTLSLTSPSTINLGRIQAGNNYLVGSLDEVAVYNTVLSAATVAAHHAAGAS